MHDNRSAAGRHWLPSIPATVFIGILGFVLFVFQDPLLNSDGDLPRHLRHGEWMLQHRSLITIDPFSYTRGGQPFVGFEYGSQLLYALAHRVGGLAGVTTLAALLIATAYALIARYMLRRNVDPLLAGFMVAAALVSGTGHWLARPHLITMVAVPLLLELLSPVSKWRFWPFMILFAIWANLHGGFVYGLVLIGIFTIAAFIDSGRVGWHRFRDIEVRRYALALGISAVAALANPWGLGIYRHIIAMFSDRYIIDHTGEFLSPDFHDAGSKLFLLVLLGVIATGFRSSRKADARTTLIVIAGTYFTLVHQRNATLFGLTVLPLLALYLDRDWRTMRAFRQLREQFEMGASRAVTRGWILLASAFTLVVGVAHGRVGGARLISDAFSPVHQPMAAVRAARAAGLQGRLFSDFGWGGYVLYAWPEQKVFIDGGTDFYGGDLMRDYSIIRSVRPGWQDLVKYWGFSTMLVRPGAPIASELTNDHGWTYWYCDSTAVIIVSPHAGTARPSTPLRATSCAPKKGGDSGAS
jgi:hypothetical protein